MLRLIFVLATTACVASVAPADDKAAKNPGEQNATTRKERLLQMLKDYNTRQQELADARDTLRPGQDRDKVVAQMDSARIQFAQKQLDLAREDDQDAIAFTAAFSAFLTGGGKKPTTEAADFIVDHLANDLKVVPAIPQMANSNGGVELLNRLAEKTKSNEIRGAVLFSVLDYEVDRIDHPLIGTPEPSAKEAAARYAAAADKLKKLAAEFADVKVSTRLGNSVSEAARKKLYFIDNMTVGKKAPDFECELIDGKKVKLSDFRGNVVVLDVWATWCTPCKAMIPHERKLVERMKDKPFKLVSLSVDDEKETLAKFLDKEKMPWIHMWNGATGGFVEQYQIQFYPTIFVLDAKGTIRFKHVREEKLDQAVESLLKEMSGMK